METQWLRLVAEQGAGELLPRVPLPQDDEEDDYYDDDDEEEDLTGGDVSPRRHLPTILEVNEPSSEEWSTSTSSSSTTSDMQAIASSDEDGEFAVPELEDDEIT